MEILFHHMNQISRVSRDSFQHYSKVFHQEIFKKNNHLIHYGQASNDVFFILDGIIQISKFQNEKEVIRKFAKKGEVIASNEANMFKTPSKVALKCLSDCSILRANYDQIQNLTLQYTDIAYFQQRAFQYQYSKMEENVADILSNSPKERYLKFKEEFLNYSHLVPKESLASYLHTDLETLEKIQQSFLNPIF